MYWNRLLSAQRAGASAKTSTDIEEVRTQFQRDYDRILFSSPFRRLQNKTQVFPLPGSVFVHNRLTHSLEVASIGRSLANMLSGKLKHRPDEPDRELFYDLSSVVMAACLAHDLGNPPFGHSGEEAISRFFEETQLPEIKQAVNEQQWLDLTHFEGNANAFRLLTHQFEGRRDGGFALTYSTLSALVKYPYGSTVAQAKGKWKYGFFESEQNRFTELANQLELIRLTDQPVEFARHPLVYLVEAADDISYLIMDIEDAHRLGILSHEQTLSLFERFFTDDMPKYLASRSEVFKIVTDWNERMAYLRARAVNKMVEQSVQAFLNHYQLIMNGQLNNPLVACLPAETSEAIKFCRTFSFEHIYNHRSVVEVELTGYNILYSLLEAFVPAVLHPEKAYSKKLLSLIPNQFQCAGPDVYTNMRGLLDFVSGMTDLYALDLYRVLKGK